MPFCWALSTIPALFAVLVWGESYVAKKMPPNHLYEVEDVKGSGVDRRVNACSHQ